MCISSISPSRVAFGTNAAKESIRIKETSPDSKSVKAMSKPCSAKSGWQIKTFDISKPKASQYFESNACSASMIAMYLFGCVFWTSAIE